MNNDVSKYVLTIPLSERSVHRVRAMIECYRSALQHHLEAEGQRPAFLRAPDEVRAVWDETLNWLAELERTLADRVSEMKIDLAFSKPAPVLVEPDPPTGPKRKRTKAKADGWGT